jgi:hypothetical protein
LDQQKAQRTAKWTTKSSVWADLAKLAETVEPNNPSERKGSTSMYFSKPIVAIAALTAGAALGLAGSEAARPDHFLALANFGGPVTRVAYERCLSAKGFGHDIEPLTLREFCGVYVTGPFIHPPQPKSQS